MVVESAVDDESGAAYVIRGIPNCGDTCYMNSLVQCLLVLDKLRTWMLGPNAPSPRGSLGVALKELFVETTPGHNAGAKLYPGDLLERLGALNAQYAGNDMQDSLELLLDLRKGLVEEEKLRLPPNMRDRVPTVVDSIFQGQLSSTLTCKCLYVSPSYDPFSELSLPLPSKGETTKSVSSPQRNPAIEETNLRKAQIDAEGGDFHIHGLELESVAMDKTSELLKTDSSKENAEDTSSPVRKKDASASGSDGQSDNARVGDLLSQQEILVEAKESTSTEQVTTEDKGKALSRNDEDCSSLASIKHCLVLYFKDKKVVWSCEKCSKVPVESGGSGPVKDLASSSTSNEESDHDVKAEKRFDMFIAHDSQNASTSPDRRKQIDLNSADQVRENKTEQKDADKTLVISKLPPVLTLHLKRFVRENNEQVKVTGHVSFEENLDVGQFMDPRSEDKDNSRYCLSGVVEHVGDSLNSGHYVAYVRVRTIGSHQQSSSESSLWFCASDEHIKRVSLEEVLKCEAFLLFYERMEGLSSCCYDQQLFSSSMAPHHKVGPQAPPRKRKKNSANEGDRLLNTEQKTSEHGRTVIIQQPAPSGKRARRPAADVETKTPASQERSSRAQARVNKKESIARVCAELPGPTPWKASENSIMLQVTERIKALR
ncbi:hypothetical protein EJB05_10241, partial [Eragrostis curvula]